MMEAIAKHRFARTSAQKARLVADQVRGLPVDKALNLLTFSPRKAAVLVKKVLESAIANAEHNEGADIDTLKVATIMVDEGPSMKRIRPRTKGRARDRFEQQHRLHVAELAQVVGLLLVQLLVGVAEGLAVGCLEFGREGQQGRQLMDGRARGRLVKIDQQIAAEDDVVMAAVGGGIELQQVALPEAYLIAQGVNDAVGIVGHVREIAFAEGHVLRAEGVAAIHARLRPLDAAGAQVIGVDAERLFRHTAIAQCHGHRIGFLSTRAGNRQDARGAPPCPAFLHQFDGGVKRLRVAEQPRFGHHHQFDQLRHFGRRERLQIGYAIAEARLLHALAHGPFGHGFGDGQAGRAAQQGLCRHCALAS